MRLQQSKWAAADTEFAFLHKRVKSILHASQHQSRAYISAVAESRKL